MSRSGTAEDSELTVMKNGSTDGIEAKATVGAGTSTLCDVTAGDWTQQVGTTVFAGAVFVGQQL